jgi:hypothetical protein
MIAEFDMLWLLMESNTADSDWNSNYKFWREKLYW